LRSETISRHFYNAKSKNFPGRQRNAQALDGKVVEWKEKVSDEQYQA